MFCSVTKDNYAIFPKSREPDGLRSRGTVTRLRRASRCSANTQRFYSLTKMLELNDKTIFLEAGSYPLADSGHWCFAGEITDVEFLMRLRLVVSDVNSSAKGLVVAWYLDNEDQDALVKIYQQCKRGYTIFILDPLPHQFRDGTQGFRLETADTVKVGNLYIRHYFDNDTIYNLDKIVPASYAKCLELEIFIRSPKDRCLNCGAQSTDGKPLQKCGHCSVARYDSKVCYS